VRASDFDFHLPAEQIAQAPLAERDASRLYLLDRKDGDAHHRIRDLPDLLPRNPLLVLNDTRVIPARLRARKPTGGRAELLLVQPLGENVWRCLGGASKPIRPGPLLIEGENPPRAEVLRVDGEFLDVAFDLQQASRSPEARGSDSPSGLTYQPLLDILDRIGEVPLPPYIHGRNPDDKERYQTIFAREPGAVAAPTAGLHFTPQLLAKFDHAFVTLHVGPGTFAPLRSDEIAPDQQLHAERVSIPAETRERIAGAKRAGRPVVAVGTTVVRALESPPGAETRLFIKPGHQFQVVDHLITNFHLPRSTLLMLVAAFAGKERILAAYAEAVKAGYRFFSYGDAMLIR
jgi:S-adenosylmethionine:tRNA ribosyltransferase-isomerase